MIIQGTTPKHTFTVPFDTGIIKSARIVYEMDGEAIVIKKMEDITLAGKTVSATLTQEETFLFTPGTMVKILLRVLTTSGEALVTEPTYKVCRGLSDKEVMK